MKQRMRGLLLLALATSFFSLNAKSGSEQTKKENNKQSTHVNGAKEQPEAPVKMAVDEKKIGPGKVGMRWKDLDFYMGGRIRSEYFFIHNFATLGQKNFFDQHGYFRQKVNFDTLARYGKQKHGKSVADGRIRFTAFTNWRDDSRYTPLSEEVIEVGNATHTVGEHSHSTLTPLWYLEEAWLELHAGMLYKGLFDEEDNSFKIGYFKYILGRGVTLGEYFDLSVTYMGWDAEAGGNSTFKTPGMLWHGTILEDKLTYDLYYQKWKEFSNRPSANRANVREHRMTGHRPERGYGSDWDIWSVRMDYKDKFGDTEVWAQPYLLYHTADDQKVEFESDVSTILGTYGGMLDIKYKNWSFNIEAAGQFGSQTVHCIDRNQIEIEANQDGKLCEVYSHIFAEGPITGFNNKVPVGLARDAGGAPLMSGGDPIKLQDIVNLPVNRALSRNGSRIVLADGTTEVHALDSTGVNQEIYNSGIFVLGKRFRPKYKLNFTGWMMMADLSYTFDDKELKVAAAGGILSGDDFPYNDECTKSYGAFIPLQDSDYLGWDVNSFALLYSRAIPRPTTLNYQELRAENNRDDMSNLIWAGVNCTWTPLKDKKKLVINPGLLFYWQDVSPYKWDCAGSFESTDATLAGVVNAVKARLGIKGWENRLERASNYLGAELNIDFYYNITENLQFRFLAAALFVGDLYKDIRGMPNKQTRRKMVDTEGNLANQINALGRKTVFGFLSRLTYYF